MTIQTATAIVQRLGPCRLILDRAAAPDLAAELALLGCAVGDPADATGRGRGGTTAYLRCTASHDLAIALHRFETADTLILHSDGHDRTSVEDALFAAGWHRHPGGMFHHEFPQWTAATLPELTYWQRAPRAEGLLDEGLGADAWIARYAAAANHVRTGDHVLIDGTHGADGGAILAALSRAGAVVQGRADLSGIPDHSVDLIVAFEPQAPAGWAARLDDYLRVLKFDGRLIAGWYAGEGLAPQDWATLYEEASHRFLPERRYVEEALDKEPDGPRHLMPRAADTAQDSDWLMLVASYNPLMGEGQGDRYENPAFPATRGAPPALVDFGAAYDNPWLYRTMVQMGERLLDEGTLSTLAECIVNDAPPESADRGAALAVLGYRVLEMRSAGIGAMVLPLIEDYAALPLTDATPVHVRRWRISLAFLAGRLHELAGDRTAARRQYRAAAESDWASFSPLLATKAIAASFYEARLHLADGDAQTALACFRQGADTAFRAAAFPHETQFDAEGQPLPFYLQELAEVIDMGSQCATALASLHLWERDPGLFWRQVDVRRFGLASWARDLERENNRLRGAA